jgi:ABC-type branched-subunit amino acid transport system ATPase component
VIATAPRISALTLVEVVGVTVRYRRRAALDAVSFTVREGEIVGLLGPAGAGKTACLDCLAGAVAPSAGRIIFDGHEVTGAPRRDLVRAGIARAQPLGAGRSRRSVANEVMVAAGRARYGGAAPLLARLDPRHRGAAQTLLARVGLAEAARERAAALPVVMRRRLEIARALAARPRLLLLDEPMAGLSAPEAAAVAALVADLRADGLTVVLAARRAPEAGLIDRAVALSQGRVVAPAAAARSGRR